MGREISGLRVQSMVAEEEKKDFMEEYKGESMARGKSKGSVV